MDKYKGFLKYKKKSPPKIGIKKRLSNYKEFIGLFEYEELKKQSKRCMDCGTPFCHSGCPLGNMIPEFNNAVSGENWKQAYQILISTNNFPEFTGRLCPAPCEHSCVLGINQSPVSIEEIEKHIIEIAFKKGYVKPKRNFIDTNKNIAIIGSGPAGLACASQLNSYGHKVTVYEKDEKIGGLLRFGIPDFKLDKKIIDRRINIMEKEGIIFLANHNVGKDITLKELENKFDAIVFCIGSIVPNDIKLPGRNLNGIHYAMEFLVNQNKAIGKLRYNKNLTAKNKNIIVLGGGDTGSDCIGTSNRQNAKSITQLEILPKPPNHRDSTMLWPLFANTFKESSSHEEGCNRQWSTLIKECIGDENKNIKFIKTVDIKWNLEKGSKSTFKEIKDSEKIIPCDLLLIAAGFNKPDTKFIDSFSINLNEKSLIQTDENYMTSKKKFFTCGDSRRGQSLVVWAIHEGRECAKSINKYLRNKIKMNY